MGDRNMTKEQYIKITSWQNETFKEANSLTKIKHLSEEIDELNIALIQQQRFRQSHTHIDNIKEIKSNLADCFILLFGIAATEGMSFEDVTTCIDEKMKLNYTRKWGQPNEEGIVNHIWKCDG